MTERTTKISTKSLVESMPEYFQRTFKENQILCPTCKGLSFYREGEQLFYCKNCDGGTIDICEFCEKPLNWAKQCDCKEFGENLRKKWKLEDQKRQKEYIEKAIKIEWNDLINQQFECWYSDSYSRNEGYFFELEDFFEDWYEQEVDSKERPDYVFGTSSESLKIDMFDVVSNHCEDLHEEAYERIEEHSIDMLNQDVREWCEKYKNDTKTYYPDYKYAIRIPWEEYDKGE